MGDHPRSRGVYSILEATPETHAGSSPLARGLHNDTPERAAAWRIIPARAGFTSKDTSGVEGGKDHPRSRGVYTGAVAMPPWTVGSSPLARGLLGVGYPVTQPDGIIPARAGFTSFNSVKRKLRRDHPRSRGVYVTRLLTLTGVTGSSPLARGLRCQRRRSCVPLGIIPARAGFTNTMIRQKGRRPDHPRSRGVYVYRAYKDTSGTGSSPLARGLPFPGMVIFGL